MCLEVEGKILLKSCEEKILVPTSITIKIFVIEIYLWLLLNNDEWKNSIESNITKIGKEAKWYRKSDGNLDRISDIPCTRTKSKIR